MMHVSFWRMTGETSTNLCQALKVLLKAFTLHKVCVFILRYKEDPWLWDLDWDVQEFKQKKVAASKKKGSKKADNKQIATPLPDWEEGLSSDTNSEYLCNWYDISTVHTDY